jgi:hypothetical protein
MNTLAHLGRINALHTFLVRKLNAATVSIKVQSSYATEVLREKEEVVVVNTGGPLRRKYCLNTELPQLQNIYTLM